MSESEEAMMNPNTIALELMLARKRQDEDEWVRLMSTIPLGPEVIQVIDTLAGIAVGNLEEGHPGIDAERVLQLAILDTDLEAVIEVTDEGEDG
ncbi:hypothetical protein [Leifsonia poae]|uniref:hypothetical protein n=1 Tax=Leifsonia poae TaxID=110933 RepID=UPI003D667FF9